MAYIYAKVNKNTLRFIRDKEQVSFDYIKRVTKFAEEKVRSWEDEESDKFPTINQAKTLAKCYHVPFAGFYMNSEDINIKYLPKIVNKRTMQDSIEDDSAVNLAIIDLLNDRDSFLYMKEELREKIPKFDLSISSNNDNVVDWAHTIRSYFDIDLSEQYYTSSKRKFYLYLRQKVESKGIFIQGFVKVPPEVMRGVAIADGTLPIIGVNDEDRHPAKSFTIIHELVHIIKRTSAICNDMMDSSITDREEVFCNAVAGEALVPYEALFSFINSNDIYEYNLSDVDKLASAFSVSSEVIARRLLDTKKCNYSWYLYISDELRKKYEDTKRKRKEAKLAGRPISIPRNMPREAIDRTSAYYCDVLLRGLSEGIIDKADLSSYIGIGEKHINKFISEVMGWY